MTLSVPRTSRTACDGVLLELGGVAALGNVHFDGDGKNDLAALLARSPSALLQVFLGDGRGGFHRTDPVSVSFDADALVFVADVDQDGSADLVTLLGSRVLELSGACLAR